MYASVTPARVAACAGRRYFGSIYTPPFKRGGGVVVLVDLVIFLSGEV